jgi:hypothetical protein
MPAPNLRILCFFLFLRLWVSAVYNATPSTPTWGRIIRRNVIDGAGTGIYLGNSDGSAPFVAGIIENNLIFSGAPVVGTVANSSDNITDTLANARLYVHSQSVPDR